MEYFLIDIALLGGLFCIHFFSKIRLFKNPKQMLLFWGFVFIIAIIWDHFAIWRGHWIYPQDKIIGINIGLMPIEDFFFIFVVNYACLLFYRLSERI